MPVGFLLVRVLFLFNAPSLSLSKIENHFFLFYFNCTEFAVSLFAFVREDLPSLNVLLFSSQEN